MRSLDDYLALVPPAHADKPKFLAELRSLLAPLVAVQEALASLPAAFDLDDAVGVQLDVVGLWIGRSRNAIIPIPGVYFSFDVARQGFDEAVWKGPFDDTFGASALDDDTYRRLLYANILARYWDGTVPGAQAAFDTFFDDPDTLVVVQDNAQAPFPRTLFAFDVEDRGFDQGIWASGPDALRLASLASVDVSMTIGVAGNLPPPIIIALLGQNGIPIKPAGVETTYAVTSVDGAPLFGFDLDNDFIAGFDTGALGISPDAALRAA